MPKNYVQNWTFLSFFSQCFLMNFGEKGGGHYMCLVGEKRVAFRENDLFPIKLMERRRPQQTRTENDYQQLDEGRLNEGTVFIYCRTGTNPAWE